MMNKQFVLSLGLLLLATMLGAQVTVFGRVALGDTNGPPIPQWQVSLFLTNSDPSVVTTTDDEGHYSFTLNASIADNAVWTVRTDDICTEVPVASSFTVSPNHTTYEVNLVICAGIDPPPPPEGCEAYFHWEQYNSAPPLTVQFFDVSYPGIQEITSWSWDFGDGTTSAEAGPVHRYAAAGTYTVTLTISGDDCTSSITQVITVWDQSNCNCPTDEYLPVCVTTAIGQLLTFTTACFAECAGYSEGQYFLCDGGGNPCGCPNFFAPVCVVTADGDVLEFPNHCFAECAGYGPDHWTDCEQTGCECPADLYDPVCVQTPNGVSIQFNNACLAECAGFEPGQYQPCDGGCACPEYWDPVCVTLDDGTVVTFSNHCFAECAGYSPGDWESCDNNCQCTDEYNPVCVATPNGGLILTFSNPCEAECAGYGPDIYYPCDGGGCVCPQIYAPVCVTTASGDILEFSNACYAECAGFGPADYTPCGNPCGCTNEYDPVCVLDPNGVIITFPNACYAECAGIDPNTILDECPVDCQCANFWDPVCVINDAGQIITFPNSCLAQCAGYTAAQFIDCHQQQDCFANFTYHFGSDSPLVVQFNDLSFAVDGITSWHWDFGDDHSSTEQNPLHTYAADGVYEVVLTIESPGCGVQVFSQHICIGQGGGFGGPSCQSFFFFEQPDPANLLTFQFLNLSLGSEGGVVWDFGDGHASTEQNPLHTYAEAGTYTVTLTVLAANCVSVTQIDVQAGENLWYGDLACRAWFLPIINPEGQEVFFINLSSTDAVAFVWDFGDGTTSNTPLASHQYAESGTYTVTLTITTTNGCTNTFASTIDMEGDGFTSNPVFSLINSTDEVASLQELTAAPNPTRGLVDVSWTNDLAAAFTWQLFDLNGRLLQTRSVNSPGGKASLQLDLSTLPGGIYLFRLQTAAGIQTLRLSKL